MTFSQCDVKRCVTSVSVYLHTSLASHPSKTNVRTYSVDVVWWAMFWGSWSLVRGRRLV